MPTAADLAVRPTSTRKSCLPLISASSSRRLFVQGSARKVSPPRSCARLFASVRSTRRILLRTIRCLSVPRLRHDADIGPRRLPALRVGLAGVVVGDRARDDHILTLLPVHRRCHLVLGGELQRVYRAEHLVEIASGGHRIDENELDLLVRADDEDVAYGLIVGGR